MQLSPEELKNLIQGLPQYGVLHLQLAYLSMVMELLEEITQIAVDFLQSRRTNSSRL
jgi:hypothetical protein